MNAPTEDTVTAQPARTAPAPAALAFGVLGGGVTLAIVGVPNLPLMWPMYRVGVVGPSCGLTRGVVEIFRGNPSLAWRFNPASFLVVAASLVLVARALAGRGAAALSDLSTAARRIGAVAACVAIGALWVHQQLNADFVMHGRV